MAREKAKCMFCAGAGIERVRPEGLLVRAFTPECCSSLGESGGMDAKLLLCSLIQPHSFNVKQLHNKIL